MDPNYCYGIPENNTDFFFMGVSQVSEVGYHASFLRYSAWIPRKYIWPSQVDDLLILMVHCLPLPVSYPGVPVALQYTNSLWWRCISSLGHTSLVMNPFGLSHVHSPCLAYFAWFLPLCPPTPTCSLWCIIDLPDWGLTLGYWLHSGPPGSVRWRFVQGWFMREVLWGICIEAE